MTAYINLDDPDVTYSHNVGNHEVYIIGSDAERIDLVRCGECKHKFLQNDVWVCPFGLMITPNGFCNYGERRSDE